jgi:V8-like Glu-specific endopeptidase
MKTQFARKFGFVVLAVLLLAGLAFSPSGFRSQASAASQAKDLPDYLVTTGSEYLAATRDWTAKELAAAVPYPLPEYESTGDALTADVFAGATGARGVAPGFSPEKTISLTSSWQEMAGSAITALPLPYPLAFTVNKVDVFSSSKKYPFSTVGVLFFKQAGRSYRCSASVIGMNAIVTAGHCVSNGAGVWSTNGVFVPAYANGVAPAGQWKVAQWLTFTAWHTGADLARDWGWGRITPKTTGSIGAKTGFLGYAWNWSRYQHWWALGYPAEAPYDGLWMWTCQSAYGYDSPFGTEPKPMGIGCDMTGGCSGGPWILQFATGNYVNSVNSHRTVGFPLELFGPYSDTAVADTHAYARGW